MKLFDEFGQVNQDPEGQAVSAALADLAGRADALVMTLVEKGASIVELRALSSVALAQVSSAFHMAILKAMARLGETYDD